jgi:hypothetical protein
MGALAGFFQIKVNGVLMDGMGDFEIEYGPPKRTSMFNSAGQFVGYKEEAQPRAIAGKVTDSKRLKLKDLFAATNATCTYHKTNEKVVVLRNAFYAGDGKESTADAGIDFRMEGEGIEEIV